jgi:ABC-type phosphate/phosphonate transport system substrate-binding protein
MTRGLQMKKQFRLTEAAGIVFVSAAIALSAAVTTAPKPAAADDCPNGGTVRFGVEPYDTSARLTPIYEKIGKMIGEKIGCKVEVYVATGYNAEIEAMRNGKLEIAEFAVMCLRIKWRRPKQSRRSAMLKTCPSPTGRAW